jgi:hypothetical protein
LFSIKEISFVGVHSDSTPSLVASSFAVVNELLAVAVLDQKNKKTE